MGIVGSTVAWLTWNGLKKIGLSASIAVFFAALLADWLNYVTTAVQLSLAFPIPTFFAAMSKFLVIYAITQVPLAIAEGILTVVIFEYIMKLRPDILVRLKVLKPGDARSGEA